jgi:hypothetical protein
MYGPVPGSDMPEPEPDLENRFCSGPVQGSKIFKNRIKPDHGNTKGNGRHQHLPLDPALLHPHVRASNLDTDKDDSKTGNENKKDYYP